MTGRAVVSIRAHVRDGQNTGRWVVDVPSHLTRSGKRERSLVNSEYEAETKRRALQGEGGLVDTTGQGPAITLLFLLEGWVFEQERLVRARRKKAVSLQNNLFLLKRVGMFLKQLPLTNLTEAHLLDYQAERLAAGVVPETVNSELGCLTQVLRWGVKHGHLKTCVSTARVPVLRKRPDTLTPTEYHALLAALPARLRPMVRLLAETGCRWGEAANLRWDAVDLDRRTAEIVASSDWSPKTAHSARTLFLSSALVADLREARGASPFVFPGRDGMKPVTTAKRAFAAAVKRCDFRRGERQAKITIKTLRKCFATWAAEGGMNERILQELMGHVPGSRVTRQHYEQARPDFARQQLSSVWDQLAVDVLP